MVSLDKLTNQQKILLIILAIFILYFYFKYLLAPLNKKVADVREVVAQKERRLIDARNKAQRLDQLQAELEASQEELEIVEKKLPRSKEVPHLIKSITKSGKKYAVEIPNFNPRPPIPHQYFQEYHYGINLSASYHGLGKFFGDICQYQRILKVKDININAKTPSEEDPSTINVSFTLVTYAYLE